MRKKTNMAQMTGGGKRKKVTTRQQKEDDKRREIEKLNREIDTLRIALEEVDGELGELSLPSVEGEIVHHTQYGEGTVTEQKDAVITVLYDIGVKKQKLPVVIANGCVTLDNEGASEDCRRILELEKERDKVRLEIRHKGSRISDLENQIARLRRQ